MKSMTKFMLVFALTASGVAIAQPASDGGAHGSNHAHSAPASVATHTTSGIVKKVDPAKGIISFAHDPIPALGWPAMTMNFSVKDKALFSKLVISKRVNIEFQQQGSDNVVTAVK
jgi:Cu(I)/Ag(I) efflux system protein CusF